MIKVINTDKVQYEILAVVTSDALSVVKFIHRSEIFCHLKNMITNISVYLSILSEKLIGKKCKNPMMNSREDFLAEH